MRLDTYSISNLGPGFRITIHQNVKPMSDPLLHSQSSPEPTFRIPTFLALNSPCRSLQLKERFRHTGQIHKKYVVISILQ